MAHAALMPTHPQRHTLPMVVFAVLGIIWGSNFIYMKMAADLLSPMQVVFCRVLFGFIPVLGYGLYSRALSWKHMRHAGHFLVMSLLATSLYYYGYVKGTSLLLSGVAGSISGSIPLFSFIFALAFIPEEKLSLRRALGVLVGLGGVLLIARPSGDQLLSTNLSGVLYMAAGSLSVGASFVYARRFITPLHIPAAALTTYQLGLALLMLSITTRFDGMSKILGSPHTLIGLVLGLGLLGTGAAYIMYYYLVEKLGAVTASSSTYIPPVVALLIGAFLVGEPLSTMDWLATALIFGGVFLLRQPGQQGKARALES